jgi:hypothetical protein
MASAAEILESRQRVGKKNSGSWPDDPLQIGKGQCREMNFHDAPPFGTDRRILLRK